MAAQKVFKYYAIRVSNVLVFRRTLTHIHKVHSRLYKPYSDFNLDQVTFSGGIVVGSLSYAKWLELGHRQIANNACYQISRSIYRSLDPYITKAKQITSKSNVV